METCLPYVYIPPGSEPNLYTPIIERITTEAQGTLICAGDFNVTLNPIFDSTGTLKNNKEN